MFLFQILRAATIVIAVIIFAAIGTFVGSKTNSAIGTITFGTLCDAFWLQGLRKIPADPPQRAIPMFWGAFIDADNGGISLKKAGWTFFPFCGFLFDYVLFDASQIKFEMDNVEERTPDSGTVSVNLFFTYGIDQQHPVRFIQAGDKEVVETKLSKRADARLREWITSSNEGPLTWTEALQSNGLAMDVLIQKLFPNELPEIPPPIIAAVPETDEISASAFIKYFTGRPPLDEKNPREKGIQAKLDELKRNNRPIWNRLEAVIRNRIDFAEKVKGGECAFPIENLGIIVTQASLGSIKADGATAAAADEVAKATQEARVQKIQSDNFKQQVEELLPTVGDDRKAAVEAIQILRKLSTKTIEEKQFALRADNVNALNSGIKDLFTLLSESAKRRADNLETFIEFTIEALQPLVKASADRIAKQS